MRRSKRCSASNGRSSSRASLAWCATSALLLNAVRGDLLAKLGRFAEARAEFERAASSTRNERERQLMQKRAEACSALAAPPPLA
jgi:predicted RNA polymerase sigma factor